MKSLGVSPSRENRITVLFSAFPNLNNEADLVKNFLLETVMEKQI